MLQNAAVPLDPTRLASSHAVEHLASLLRNVPDFPTPGIQFKDITPLLADARAFHIVLDLLAEPFIGADIRYTVAMEARGFIFGGALAARINAGFVPVRKPGKLPAETHSLSYDLEYGSETLEMHVDAIVRGQRVLIVDDVLATGGTAKATVDLVREAGGTVHGVAVLMELSFLPGRATLGDVPLTALRTV